MQENRLSSVQVDAPTTEKFSETTEEPTSTTEDEVSSTYLQVTADTKDVTTSEAAYKQTETLMPVTSTTADISTSLYTDRGDISYRSYFIPASQVTTTVTQTAADDAFRVSTESLDSTTANLESTNVESENTTTELSFLGRLSTEDDISLSTYAADENAVTSTSESLFQGTTRDNDQEHDDGESVNNLDTSHGAVGNAGEVNSEGDENKQRGNNTFEKLPEEDVNRPGNGDETRTEVNSSEGAYSQGDISGSNSEGHDKNAEDSHQVDDSQSSGKLSIISGDGNEPYLIHEEPQNYGTPETAPLDHTSGADTAEATDSSSSPLPGSYETPTSTSSK
jgi:hypothetical protein